MLLVLRHELGHEAVLDTHPCALPSDTAGHASREPVGQLEAEGERVLTRRQLSFVQREREVNDRHEACVITVVIL